VSAFVLKYRLPNGRAAIPSLDARRAVRLVRERASEWKVDPARVGIWGFSAGGHLAATVCTATPEDSETDAAAGVKDGISARPDFAVLFYPVISMEEGVTHGGSRKNLGVGDAPEAWSCDLRVTAEVPPTFLLHAGDDAAVPLENGLRYLAALRRHRVPLEALIYETGGHGPPAFEKNPTWEAALEAWMRRRGLTPAP
jgi:acetyl esterase/lipase